MKPLLVVNSGSSSIKYRLFDMSAERVLAGGVLEGIGEPESRLTHLVTGDAPVVHDVAVADHRAGFEAVQRALDADAGLLEHLCAIGHRVVHGGDRFSAPALIDDQVLATIEQQIPLAPLHNPSNLEGIRTARRRYPEVPQVAVFDTAFHATMPPRAYRYALPTEITDRYPLRRYGFHGTSHAHVAAGAAAHLGRPLPELALISLHLGNGASAAAIAGGRSIDTSMGLTPLPGLVMGTRCGDLDPSVVLYLQREAGLSVDQVDALLNQASGLKGLTGSNDVRTLTRRAQTGERVATEALDLFAYRVRSYVGAYAVALGRLDAVVFTGGIGEHSVDVRAAVCEGLGLLGVTLDAARNAAPGDTPRTISADDSPVAVLVVPTNEELEIARQTLALIAP